MHARARAAYRQALKQKQLSERNVGARARVLTLFKACGASKPSRARAKKAAMAAAAHAKKRGKKENQKSFQLAIARVERKSQSFISMKNLKATKIEAKIIELPLNNKTQASDRSRARLKVRCIIKRAIRHHRRRRRPPSFAPPSCGGGDERGDDDGGDGGGDGNCADGGGGGDGGENNDHEKIRKLALARARMQARANDRGRREYATLLAATSQKTTRKRPQMRAALAHCGRSPPPPLTAARRRSPPPPSARTKTAARSANLRCLSTAAVGCVFFLLATRCANARRCSAP